MSQENAPKESNSRKSTIPGNAPGLLAATPGTAVHQALSSVSAWGTSCDMVF